MDKALGKVFPKKIQKFFAKCLGLRTRQSIFFKKKTLPSVWAGALGKVFLKIKNKKTLPSAWAAALGKVFFFKSRNSLPSAWAGALGKVNF